MSSYTKSYECGRCTKIFKRCFNLQRHEVKCDARVKLEYPRGVYTLPKSIFDKLEEEGVEVPEDLKFSKHFATFDIEVYYPKCDLPTKRPKLEYTDQHALLSVSVASNVPTLQEPKCFIVGGPSEEDARETVNQLINYLNEISDEAYQLEQKRYEPLKRLIGETIKSDSSEQASVSEEEDTENCHVGYDNDSEEEGEEEEMESDEEFINDEDIEEEDASFYRRFDHEHSTTHTLSTANTTTTTTTTTQNQQTSKRKTLAQKLIVELDKELCPADGQVEVSRHFEFPRSWVQLRWLFESVWLQTAKRLLSV